MLVPDAPLTKLGREQSARLNKDTQNSIQKDAELLVISPVSLAPAGCHPPPTPRLTPTGPRLRRRPASSRKANPPGQRMNDP